MCIRIAHVGTHGIGTNYSQKTKEKMKQLHQYMKRILLFAALSAMSLVVIAAVFFWHRGNPLNTPFLERNKAQPYERVLHHGDIIFHTSISQQSKAIQKATHSPYSHCGIIYKKDNTFMVLEAIQPVKTTPLGKWIDRGRNGHFVVKRLHNAEHRLTPTVLQRMQTLGEQWQGKPYDPYFEWSDTAMYCSELVWKLYKWAAGVELCPVARLRSFDLTSKEVQHLMKQRYGTALPLDEPVVSPDNIFTSKKLRVVYEE